MIIIDNSVFSRNGDIIPNRFRAQLDSVGSLITYKTNDNLETSVGLMTMGGINPKLLTTPTNQTSALYSQFSKISINGQNHFSKSLQIAQLAMLHRTNKKQHERVIAFVASEIKDSDEILSSIGRNFKRNGTALDIINICNNENVNKIQKLIDIVDVGNSEDCRSSFINYEPGVGLLLDAIKSSTIMGNVGLTGQIANDDYMDDELQMVLRISMEEEEKRQRELEEKKNKELNKNDMKEEEIVIDKKVGEDKKEGNDVNQYINDPEFIKEILGDLNMDNKDQTIKEVMNWDKNDKKDEGNGADVGKMEEKDSSKMEEEDVDKTNNDKKKEEK